jgi:hypothetical protein
VQDWDPNDPDNVKVHYDVSGWNLEQRAELTAALADEEITHVWADDELVVPEELETKADRLFTRLEDELGPFPITLDPDADAVEYGLDEWPDADRETLTAALVDAAIAHRWEGPTLLVASDAEQTVDALLDEIEAGTLAAAAPPEDALSRLFAAADRLAKDPEDSVGREEIAALVEVIHATHPPYGLAKNVWTGIVDAGNSLADLCDTEEPAATDVNSDATSSNVIGAAQQLRSLVRPYV